MLGLLSHVETQVSRNKRRFNLLMLEENEYYFEDSGACMHIVDAQATPAQYQILQDALQLQQADSQHAAHHSHPHNFHTHSHSSQTHSHSSHSHSHPSPPSSVSIPFHSLKRVKGRLHLCSKSLVFDPDDPHIPMQKFMWKHIHSIRKRKSSVLQLTHAAHIHTEQDSQHSTAVDGEEHFILHISQVVDIQPNTPYNYRKLSLASPDAFFIFSLTYMDLSSFFYTFLCRLHSVYQNESESTRRKKQLEQIIRDREESIPFDSSSIVDLREKPLFSQSLLAAQVSPLVLLPGRFFLTDMRLYFQPFNNVTSEKVLKVDISDMRRIYKRRHAMRHVGLEIFVNNKNYTYSSQSYSSNSSAFSSTSTSSSTSFNFSSQTSYYFTFDSTEIRDEVYALITNLPCFTPQKQYSLSYIVSCWLNGQISNFDYLLYLNQYAGRSFQDLTQYPVFPWVIADYTSETLDLESPRTYRDLTKPIGALEPSRLENFRRRCKDMPLEMCDNKPFLYGTHYSTPGYVLFYLVRKAPQYQLKLQNGRFDHADRLFNSLASTWNSCLTGPTDVKELIPEFFFVEAPSTSDFLINDLGLELGVRQNGKEVGDVELPRWCKNKSSREFLRKNREALESRYVSSHLHHWIDLIFGFKQQGKPAYEADNVFYHLTYEGAVDIEKITDPVQKKSIIQQINEFGQTPRQIFQKLHPQKGTLWSEEINPCFPETVHVQKPTNMLQSQSQGTGTQPQPPQPTTATNSSSSTSSATLAASSSSSSSSSSSNSANPASPLSPAEVAATLAMVHEVNSIEVRELTLEDDLLHHAQHEQKEEKRVAEKWTRVTSWTTQQVLNTHRDSVTALCFSPDNSSILSVSADSHIKLFSLTDNRFIRSTKIGDLTLSSCAFLPQHPTLIAMGSWDNHLYLYNVNYGRILSTTQAHDDAISTIDVKENKLLTGSWDATLKLWQVTESGLSASPILTLSEHDTPIKALSMDHTGTLAVSGAEDGSLIFWDLRQENSVRVLSLFNDEVSALSFSRSHDPKNHSQQLFQGSFSPGFSSLELFVASADQSLKYLDLSVGKEIAHWDTDSKITSLYSDGFGVACGSESGEFITYDAHNLERTPNVELTFQRGVNAFDFSQDGKLMVVGLANSKDNVVILQADSADD